MKKGKETKYKKIKLIYTYFLSFYLFKLLPFLLIFLFKFNLNEEEPFKKYYSNLSIDENKINKYIKGIKNKINIKEIKEKTMLIFVILILNINQEQYFIKSLKN